jgi:hypothetical protein
MADTLDIFFAYAQVDEPLRDALEKHLSTLEWQGLITSWHNQKVLPGQEWEQKTLLHLRTAHLILLLVSPDFLADHYFYRVELEKAIERHQRGETTVIPVILREVDWRNSPLGKLQALPSNGRPVASWRNRDKAFLSIAEGIRKVVEAFRKTAKEKEQASWDQPLLDEAHVEQKREILEADQRVMKRAQSQQATTGKYNVQVAGNVQGFAQGDHQQVTMHFDNLRSTNDG